MTLYVLLNGPRRSGKSSIAYAIADSLEIDNSISVIGMSYHLKRFVHSIYLGAKGFQMDPDHFDATKEHPQEILGGMSWRQAYIHYSENVIKPLHGKEWFGRMLIQAADYDCTGLIVVPDSGFREEAEEIVRSVGDENVLLVRLHRPGHGFEGDSRGYVDLSDLGVESHDIWATEGGLDYAARKVVGIVKTWHENGRLRNDIQNRKPECYILQ
jgi:hypothetical protein